MRWYTAGVAVVTGTALATAIEMRSVADQAQGARARAAASRAYVAGAEQHARETSAAIRKLTRQYDRVLSDAKRTQRRMLADLRKARKAAQSAGKINLAPIAYSTSFASAPGVSAAAAGAPVSGTS